MQAPSVALPVTTLAELCAGLPFDFGEALQPARAASALAATRVVFHRTTESVRNQAVVVLVLFKRLLAALRPESPVPRMAVLLPDVLPETSEIQCAVLLEVFLRRPDILDSANITVLSRRGPRLLDRLPPAFAGIRVDWDWSSPSILSSFDFVVVMCSAMHFALAQELTAGQDPFPRTLFFVATTGISPKRAQNILQSQNVVLPCFQFEPKPEDKRFDHWVCFNNAKFAPGIQLPDLDILKQCFVRICLENRFSQGEASELIARIMPETVVAGIEFFESLQVPRLNFPSSIIDFSRV